MHGHPDEPGGEATEANLVAFENGEAFADHGQVSFIEIAERRRVWVFQ